MSAAQPTLQNELLAADGTATEDGFSLRVSAEQLGKIFGVSRPRIYQLKDQGMPIEGPNTFDVCKCVQWRLDKLENQFKLTPDTQDSTRSQLNRAQTEKLEIEIAEKRRELIPASQVAFVLNGIATMLATRLDGLAPRTAPLLADMTETAEIQNMMLSEHRGIRSSIAASIKAFAADLPADVEPMPAKPKRAKKKRTTKKKATTKVAE